MNDEIRKTIFSRMNLSLFSAEDIENGYLQVITQNGENSCCIKIDHANIGNQKRLFHIRLSIQKYDRKNPDFAEKLQKHCDILDNMKADDVIYFVSFFTFHNFYTFLIDQSQKTILYAYYLPMENPWDTNNPMVSIMNVELL